MKFVIFKYLLDFLLTVAISFFCFNSCYGYHGLLCVRRGFMKFVIFKYLLDFLLALAMVIMAYCVLGGVL